MTKQIQTVEGLKSLILDIIQTDSNNLEKTEAIRAFDKETEHIWQHWIDQAQKVIEALQADRERLRERVEGMMEYYGLSPKQKGAKKYNPEKNGYIEGYSQALEDVLSMLEED